MPHSVNRQIFVGVFVAAFLGLHTYVKITQPDKPTPNPWSFTRTGPGMGVTQIAQTAQGSRLTLMVFFDSPCDPCRDALIALQELSVAKRDQGLAVLGVFGGDDRTQRFARSLGANFPLVHDDGGVLTKQFGADIKPTLVLLDSTMHVLQTNVGFDRGFLQRVQAMLDEASP